MSPTLHSDEAQDAPLITTDLVYLLGLILLVLGIAIGTTLGSWLLHSFDAEIRHALAQAGAELQRLYWAACNLHG